MKMTSSSSMESYVFYWNEFQANIAAALQELRADEEFFDVTLSVDEENQIRAHRVILAASSGYFRAILKRHANTPNPVLVMPSTVKYTELSSLVHFMYNGEVSILEDQIESFMALAETMKVKGLVEDKVEEKPAKIAPKMPKLPPGINVRIDRTSSSSEFGSPLRSEPSPSPAAKKNRPGPCHGTGRPTGPGKATPNQLVKNPNMSASTAQLPQSSTSHDVADESGSFNESAYEDGEYGQFGIDANGSREEPSGSSQPQAAARPGPSFAQGGPSGGGTRLVALQCPKCPNRLPGVEAFKEHMETAHGEGSKGGNEDKPQPPKEESVLCSICDKSFKNKRYMIAHQKRVHKVGLPEGGGLLGEPPAKKGRKPKKRELDEEQLAHYEEFMGDEEAYIDEDSEMAPMQHQEMPKPKGMGSSKTKQSASASGDPLERLPHGEGSSGTEGARALAPGGGARGPQRPRPPIVPPQFAEGSGRGRGRGKRGRPPGSLNKSAMIRQPRPDSSSGSGSGGSAAGGSGRGNSMDLKRLGMKLGGQISISSSDQAGPRRSASGSGDGRPGYSITKSASGNSMRPSTSRAGSDMPAIVKQEPMESHFVNADEAMYEEDEDYGDYEDGGPDGGYDLDGAGDLYGDAGAYEEGLEDEEEYEGYEDEEDGVYGEATPK